MQFETNEINARVCVFGSYTKMSLHISRARWLSLISIWWTDAFKWNICHKKKTLDFNTFRAHSFIFSLYGLWIHRKITCIENIIYFSYWLIDYTCRLPLCNSLSTCHTIYFLLKFFHSFVLLIFFSTLCSDKTFQSIWRISQSERNKWFRIPSSVDFKETSASISVRQQTK